MKTASLIPSDQTHGQTPDAGHSLAQPATPGARGRERPVDTVSGPSSLTAEDSELLALIGKIAGQLRIDASTIALSQEDAGPGGAFAFDGTIHLPRPLEQRGDAATRGLLAHEAAHVAQARLPGAPLTRLADVHVAAEIEAESFARDFTERGTGRPVRVPLPRVKARAGDFAALVATVKATRSDEIDFIKDKLSYGLIDWAVTDNDVTQVLRVLDTMPMLSIRAVGNLITSKYRERLFGNLGASHYETYRMHILAIGWAAESAKEFEACDNRILASMALENLEPLEAMAVSAIVALAPQTHRVADSKRQARIDEAITFAASEKAASALTKGFEEATKEEDRLTQLATDRKAAKESVDSELAAVANEIREGLDEFHVSDNEALGLLDKAATACLDTKDPAPKVLKLATYLEDSYLDELIDQVPVDGLYKTERRRSIFVHLLAQRSAFKNMAVADKLLSSPWYEFWDTVTSEEAYLAYLLVKSMPPLARDAAIKAFGGETWSTIIAELPTNIRESATFNFYTGGEGQKDRQNILLTLTDDELWDGSQPDRLDAVLRIAEAAGESEFAFAQSKAREAYKNDKLKPIVAKHGLYDPKNQETFKQEELQGHAWYEEGILGKIAGLGHALKILFGLRNVHLFGFVLRNTPLIGYFARWASGPDARVGADVDLTDVGEAGGARFRQTSSEDRKDAEAKGQIPENFVRVAMLDLAGGLEVEAGRIVIDKLALPGTTRMTASPVTCVNLKLSIRYTPYNYGTGTGYKPIGMDASFDELSAENATMATQDSIFAINLMKMRGVKLTLSNTALDQTGVNDGIKTMFAALLAPETASGLDFATASLKLAGVATSSGLYVQAIDIEALTLGAGGTAETYKAALQRSHDSLIERREQIETDLAKATGEDRNKLAARKSRIEAELIKIKTEMERGVSHGTVLDIRKIHVSGVPGLSSEPVDLEDIHGQGRSVSGPIPLFSDSTALRDIIQGKAKALTVKGAGPRESFSIDIGSIDAKQPLKFVGEIPTAEQAKKELEDFKAKAADHRTEASYEPVLKSLQTRAEQAEKLEALLAKGVQTLVNTEDDKPLDQLRELRKALRNFEEQRATIVATLHVEGLTLNIDDQGMPEVVAQKLTATGIRTFRADGQEALHVGSVEAVNFRLAAELKDGLGNYKAWRTALQSGKASAESLTIRDFHHGASGASFEELNFRAEGGQAGLDVDVRRSAGDTSAQIKSGRITAKGINGPVHKALLEAERDRINAIMPPDKRSADEVKRLAAITEMLGDLTKIDEAEKAAQTALDAASKEPQKSAARKALAKAQEDRRLWGERLVVKGLTIEQLNLSISGLGDVLDPDWSFDKSASALKVKGEGKDGHWLEKATAEGIALRGAKGDQTIAAKIEAGPIGGEVSRTEKGYALKKLSIGRLAATGLSYTSGTTTAISKGESALIGISIDATYEKQGEDRFISVTSLKIDEIAADQLHYEDEDMIVDVTSGSLLGINVEGLNALIPADPKAKTQIDGNISVGAIKDLVIGASVGGYKVSGTINAQPAGKDAKAISVKMAKDGERTFALNSIAAAIDVHDIKTGNRVKVVLKKLGGTIIQNGDKYNFTGLTIGDLTLSQAKWSASGKVITIKDQVALKGIAIDGVAERTPKKRGKTQPPLKEGEAPEKELTTLYVSKLAVDSIDAKAVEVEIPAVAEDKTAGVEYSARKHIDLRRAHIDGLRLTGFDLLNSKGKVEIKDRVSVDLRATIGEAAKHDLKQMNVSATIYGKDTAEPGQGGRELSATLKGEDGVLIRLGRTSELTISDLSAQGQSEGKKGVSDTLAKAGKLSLANITTGDLIVTDTLVSISDIEIGGPIAISQVDWTATGVDLQHIHMDTATITDMAKIGKVEARFRKVATGKMKDGKEVMRSEMSGLTMTGLTIPKLTATGLTYKGLTLTKEGARAAKIVLPSATVNGISVDKFDKDYVSNLTALNAKIASTEAPGFTVTLVDTLRKQISIKKFGADLKTGEIRADAIFKTINAGTKDEKTELESGYFELDKLGLRNITGTMAQTGKKTSKIGNRAPPWLDPSLGVDKIRHDKSGTKLTGSTLSNVYYTDPNMGLKLDLESLTVPDTMTIPTSGPVTIPRADIRNATFEIDDLLNMGGSSGGTKGGTPLKTEQFYNILDHVNGSIKTNVYAPIYVDKVSTENHRMYLRQDVFPLDMSITDGKVNYNEMWRKATWARNDLVASMTMDTDAVKVTRGRTGDLIVTRDWSKSYLTLSVASRNLIDWTPSDSTERAEMTGGDVRLKRLIRPDPDLAKEAEEKEEVEAIKNSDLSEAEKKAELEKREAEKKKKQAIDPAEIQLRDVDANIAIKGSIPLDLGDMGDISLGVPGEDALAELRVTGNSTSKLQWGLSKLGVSIQKLKLGDTTIGGNTQKGAQVHIDGVEDGSIDFADGSLLTPRRLQGRITSGSVKDLLVDLGGDK